MTVKRGIAFGIVAAGCTFWLYAFAVNRKVTIPADSTGIRLFNGFTAAVTFNATCYDTSGTVAFTSNAVNLGAKQSLNLTAAATPVCQDLTSFSLGGFINGMGGCSSYYTDYASAMAGCPTGYHGCTLPEYTANQNAVTTDAFLSDSGLSGWSYSTDNGGTWTNNSSGKPRASYTAAEKCATGASGGGTVYASCTSTEYSANDGGPLCCPDTLPAAACVVEITSPNGHLQSPQFKGNAPF